MTDYTMEELAKFEWMESRIPALPALAHFIPEGPRNAAVDAFATAHRSRWFPQDRGTRVLVSMEKVTDFDSTLWAVEEGAWEHEHCDFCNAHIPAMTLCWVTTSDPYVLLCGQCHAKATAAAGDA